MARRYVAHMVAKLLPAFSQEAHLPGVLGKVTFLWNRAELERGEVPA